MSLELVAASGWGCAVATVALLWVLRRRLRGRMALVAEAAHELRGPLTTVELGLATLSRDPDPARARTAAALDFELQRASLALEDLAAAPAGGRAGEAPGLVDVGDLLAELVEAWAPAAAAFGTRVSADPPEAWWVLRGDRRRLAQGLGNLVANALEHGEGPVRVRARPTAGGRLRLEVVDGGGGLAGGLPAPARRGHPGPRGHGLAVARRVAERAGGCLRAERGRDGHVVALELELA